VLLAKIVKLVPAHKPEIRRLVPLVPEDIFVLDSGTFVESRRCWLFPQISANLAQPGFCYQDEMSSHAFLAVVSVQFWEEPGSTDTPLEN
jgi:hypothetical protein